MYTGPHLIKDELLFGYDSGYGVADNSTATRFYPGEPTTNFVTTNLETTNPDGSGQSSVGTRTTIAPNHVRIVDVASNTRQSHLISGLTASTIYTVSIQFKKITGTPTFRFQLQGYSGSSYVNTIKFTSTAETGLEDIKGWQTAEWTFTLPSNCNALRIWWQDGADYTTYNHSFELKNPQLEAKSHVTPYVSGTRSSTASLINLGSSGDINVNTISFDSTGQPTFDGTDDKIVHDPGTFPRDFNETFSIEVIYYVPASASWSGVSPARNSTILARGGYGGVWGLTRFTTNNRLGFYMRTGTGQVGSNLDPYYTIERDKYYHIVATWNGSTTATLYVNGVSVSTDSITTVGSECDNTGNILIGGGTSFSGSNGGYVEAKIPVAKVFKKCLTAAEVKQNFKAYKNRFNI
jgi:hypothetical protein